MLGPEAEQVLVRRLSVTNHYRWHRLMTTLMCLMVSVVTNLDQDFHLLDPLLDQCWHLSFGLF